MTVTHSEVVRLQLQVSDFSERLKVEELVFFLGFSLISFVYSNSVWRLIPGIQSLDADSLFQADVDIHRRVCFVDVLVSWLSIEGDESSEPGRIVII